MGIIRQLHVTSYAKCGNNNKSTSKYWSLGYYSSAFGYYIPKLLSLSNEY
jgi:hypothetical protein